MTLQRLYELRSDGSSAAFLTKALDEDLEDDASSTWETYWGQLTGKVTDRPEAHGCSGLFYKLECDTHWQPLTWPPSLAV